jgi:enoyl-[acyl-carrier protein] reductase/trans-2-enoyl-CoA reductase (NAD+)
MTVAPMVRNNICLNAHPVGCAREVELQVERAEAASKNRAEALSGPRAVLVVGCSTGYGLASRIAAAFACGAATVGFSLEKAAQAKKTGSPGWYANRKFDALAAQKGRFARSFDMDAFSREAKEKAISAAREGGFAYDLVVYSLASPVRVDPDTGYMYRSVIKPIGRPYSGRSVDVFSGRFGETKAEPADSREIEETVKVMGGEDWELWMKALSGAGVLAQGARSVAYSYIGPSLSWPIYRDGTIGKAKEDLQRAAKAITASLKASGVKAYISVNKAVVTRASSVIPVIPLYVSTLFKVMKERGIHEDCMDQMLRLFSERLYRPRNGQLPLDGEGRIRLDELEMGSAVQDEVSSRLARIDDGNLRELADIDGFRGDFLRVHGFEVPGVDYSAEVDPLA